MINYKLQKNSIYETHTSQVIYVCKDNKEAKKKLKHFNFGGGFDGWTPEFVLRTVTKYIKR